MKKIDSIFIIIHLLYSGIIDISDTSKFTYESISKYKEIPKESKDDEDNFCAAVSTAYVYIIINRIIYYI